MTFRITLRGTRVRVTVRSDELELTVEDGTGEVAFAVRDEEVVVGPDAPVVVALKHQGPRLEGEPPNPAGTLRADGTVIAATIPKGE